MFVNRLFAYSFVKLFFFNLKHAKNKLGFCLIYCALCKKKMHLQQFFDTAPYTMVHLMVAKIR